MSCAKFWVKWVLISIVMLEFFLEKKSLRVNLLSGHLFICKDRVKHVLCGTFFVELINELS